MDQSDHPAVIKNLGTLGDGSALIKLFVKRICYRINQAKVLFAGRKTRVTYLKIILHTGKDK
jgi:hypothetical protein